MKITALLILVALASYAVCQNCAGTSTGYPPLNDLGTGLWKGAQGGLYPSGLNTRPVAHTSAGLQIASHLQPLDTAGNADSAKGKIVLLSIGMSNTTMEFQAFLPMESAYSAKNPKLVCVDGAQGGQAIVQILPPDANFWTVILTRLAAQGLTAGQVQVVWFKQAEMNPADTSFPGYADSLKVKFKSAMRLLKIKYPNLVLCYLSSRIYGGYSTGTLNPEPYAYYSGWSVKRLIEDQINGDTALAYSGANARSPWLSWGPYLWADGTTARNDGLTWICPDDFNTDGTHPGASGRQKVAQMLLDFFSTEQTTMPWFLSAQSRAESRQEPDAAVFNAFPNPLGAATRITFEAPASARGTTTIELFDLQGRKLLTLFRNAGTEGRHHVTFEGLDAGGRVLKNGVYFCRFKAGAWGRTIKIAMMR